MRQSHGTISNASLLINAELRKSDAILGAYLEDLRYLSRINLEAAVSSLVYLGLMVVCLILNTIRMYNYYTGGDEGVFEYPLHFVEFWATFFFSLVMTRVMMTCTSPNLLPLMAQMSVTIRAITLLNIATALVPAVLISINLPYFELPAHNIEYTNTLILTLINIFLLFGNTENGARPSLSWCKTTIVAIGLLAGALQLVLYNALPDPLGEMYGHLVEFPLEIVSAAMAYRFAMETKAKADEQAIHQMYALHDHDLSYGTL
jgi:hypothetical protein